MTSTLVFITEVGKRMQFVNSTQMVIINHLKTLFIWETKAKMLQGRMSLLRRHDFTQISKCTGRVKIGLSQVDVVVSDLQTRPNSAACLLQQQSCRISLDHTGGSL